MQIENVRMNEDKLSPKGFKCLCTFNLQITAGLMLYDLQLLQAPDGKNLVFPPKSINGSPLCSMSPQLRDEIAEFANIHLLKRYAEQAGNWFNTNYFNHEKKAR
ncbi:hypothetical protein [Agrobacterium sp. NPDC089420]|uniref:hypothetical protein n=1 Tax=Agrobacterium sp. NPDC089420 TaxID=3363918 RepID=UPI00384E5B08